MVGKTQAPRDLALPTRRRRLLGWDDEKAGAGARHPRRHPRRARAILGKAFFLKIASRAKTQQETTQRTERAKQSFRCALEDQLGDLTNHARERAREAPPPRVLDSVLIGTLRGRGELGPPTSGPA